MIFQAPIPTKPKPAFGGAQILTFQPLPDRYVGQSTALNVSSDAGLTNFTFDSNDSSVVSFGGNATDGYTVTGLKEGRVIITATTRPTPGTRPPHRSCLLHYRVTIKILLLRKFLIRMFYHLALSWKLMQPPSCRYPLPVCTPILPPWMRTAQ